MQFSEDGQSLLFKDHGIALILTRREGDSSHAVLEDMVQELRK
jgi:hypothetical protein